uniref:Bradykinin-potentiating peptide Pb n=1 Tax=Phyllomedusa burmeisteri TaxID=39413 RepID=BPPBP_PHYBU|nr:RecName: Full=Bradykinin-potentiating peptide Pb; Short=BPP Pb [Phyllomedusa burmeisteri]
QTLLQELPIPP